MKEKMTLTIKQLFDFLQHKYNFILDENQHYILPNDIDIFIPDERNNNIRINALYLKKDNLIKFKFNTNEVLICANNHLISFNGIDCIKAKDYSVGDIIIKNTGIPITIKAIEILNIDYVYDIEVNSNTHLYSDTQGIIHHNTLLACYIALELYKSAQIKKIIITRPTVSREDIGHLPGTAEEKLAPWMAPIFANMYQILDKQTVNIMLEEGSLEIVPVTHMRGRTFTDAAIIFDEFQNAENGITQMILERIGIDSKMFLCGDYNQIDLKNGLKKLSGVYMVEGMEKIEGVCRIELNSNHRHPILQRIMDFFEKKNAQYK